MSIEVKIQKLHKDAKTPEMMSKSAGAYDLYVTEIVKKSNRFIVCKLGFALQPPKTHRVVLSPRSSLTKHDWFMNNSPGVGDADYTGEYQMRFRATPIDVKLKTVGEEVKLELVYPEFPYVEGDRVGQMYLEKIEKINWKEVDKLDETDRGDGGFGSTGK